MVSDFIMWEIPENTDNYLWSCHLWCNIIRYYQDSMKLGFDGFQVVSRNTVYIMKPNIIQKKILIP